MNGFVVLLGCSIDDFPVRLCATMEEATAFISGRDPLAGLTAEEEDVMGMDQSEPVCFSVVEFRDGKPVSREF